MIKKDSKYSDVHSMLKATGKATFVNFYYDFKNPSFSDNYICEKIYKESPTAKSPNQRYRVPRARQIFRTNQQIDALEIIINSKKLSNDIIEKAKLILKSELVIQNDTQDKLFINELNNDFDITDETVPFEYNNTIERPKEKSITSHYVYNRDKKVAKNALKKAGYLCEIDKNHRLFIRKHTKINYTEPHHLIPLSAQKDFPNVNLDREQNIVSLCSHCHNLLHYGNDIDDVLKFLYSQRKEVLEKIGISLSYEELKKYYD